MRKSLLLAAILTFIVGVVATFPARIAYRWFAPPTINLSGISGSIWFGSAQEVMAGTLYLRDLAWRIKPAALLRGTLAYAIGTRPAAGFIDLVAEVNPTGTVTLSDVNVSVPLAAFEMAVNVPGLGGEASARFERLTVENGFPTAADGEVQLIGLIVPLIDGASLGGYRADFSTSDGGIVADVQDTDGVFDLVGQLTISREAGIEFLGQVAPKPQTSAKLRRQMQILGTPNARGQREVRLQYEVASAPAGTQLQ